MLLLLKRIHVMRMQKMSKSIQCVMGFEETFETYTAMFISYSAN